MPIPLASSRGAHQSSRWLGIVVVAVLAASALYVANLRLSTIPDRAMGHAPAAVGVGVPRTKEVQYLVTGPAGAQATISYLIPGGGVTDTQVSLPWHTTLTTQDFTTAAGVLAQVHGNGPATCVVRVNGTQRAVDRANRSQPVVNCAVPTA